MKSGGDATKVGGSVTNTAVQTSSKEEQLREHVSYVQVLNEGSGAFYIHFESGDAVTVPVKKDGDKWVRVDDGEDRRRRSVDFFCAENRPDADPAKKLSETECMAKITTGVKQFMSPAEAVRVLLDFYNKRTNGE